MRKFAVCAFAALIGWAGMASAVDVRELQAKLAAQEAALNDIEAKMSAENGDGTPEQMTSMRKNAKVTIGGLVTTGYFYTQGKVKEPNGAGGFTKTVDAKGGSLEVSDAELELEIEVNEHMDAYLLMDFHATATENYGTAKAYWVRWKNICESGFGIKVGRDSLVFGDGDAQVGYLDGFAQSSGDSIARWDENGWVAPHNVWDIDGVTQITPYWEGFDGKLLLETSFMAHIWNDEVNLNGGGDSTRNYIRNGVAYQHSRNYGLGTMSARATWTPIEDLRFSASVVNYHTNGTSEAWDNEYGRDDYDFAKNNTAAALSFTWRPCFFNKMNIWGQYIHGWNVAHIDDAKSDVVNFGVSFDLTEKLTAFAQGDYMRVSYDRTDGKFKQNAWAAYVGLIYDLGNGATLEGGWRHEKLTDKLNGDKFGKVKSDTIYATLGFEF